jgi:hypothetical protein
MMLVYGDAERLEDSREKRDAVIAALEDAAGFPPGPERHAALVTAFIEAGEWVQGLADAEFEARGCDALSAVTDAAMRGLLGLALAIDRSWSSRFAVADLPSGLVDDLRAFKAAGIIRTKRAEGYAFYALYPELFVEAARRSGLSRNTRVIGIRSIGTGLAALVAAALDAPLPVTVRPVGHPFRREVRIDAALRENLLTGGSTFAIVDEGPGLSGSSFGAVADWLEAQGIARERIHVFPSHGGDLGPKASDEHRARWTRLPRHVVNFDEAFPKHLRSWCEAMIGPLDAPLEDLSGGAWRSLRYDEERVWPAANLQQERRKYLARAGGEMWLLKFVGLGREAVRKLSLAGRLAEAGFTPPSIGLRHGFLVEGWIEGARSLDQVALDRGSLIRRLGAYCGFRANLPAGDMRGASAEELLRMAQHNTRLGLGEEAASHLRFDPAALEPRIRRVVTDNRMMPHEWLITGDGRVLKADALDHHAAHDLVGCQDIAWDIAGAAVEFGLSDDERAQLAAITGHEAGQPVDPELLRFYMPCYLAFRLGAATLAAEANGGAEAQRLTAAAERYREALKRLLAEQLGA